MRRTLRASLAVVFAALISSAQPLSAQAVAELDTGRSARTREHVVDDVFHETLDVHVGSGPNAVVRLHRVVRERAPFRPRATRAAVMLLHGDFSSFRTNFASAEGLAIWLAQQQFDVWGIDRRWALTPQVGELTDFAEMSLAQELDDTHTALALAEALRGPSRDAGFHLIGFSRGGFLAYAAAAQDAQWRGRPLVRSLVPLDIWAEIAPEDEAARSSTCAIAVAEREQLAQGNVDVDNSYFISVGELATTAPNELAPESTDVTNRDVFLQTAAQTYYFFAPSEFYHLAAGNIRDDVVLNLRESPEPSIAQWFAHATPHQSLRESVDTDGIWCGDAEGRSVAGAPTLSDIRIPLLLITAAGGYGEHAVYSTTRVSSRDVSVLRVQRQPAASTEVDFGHGDLLFARNAPALVWKPLADWLRSH